MFKTQTRRVFKDINIKRTIARELINLKQKKATSIYAVYFQKVLFNLNWDNTVLIEQFYRSLKNIVKNDIEKEEQSITL